MAQPTTKSWTKLTLWVEDDNSPANYGKHVCGMTTKSFSISAQTADSTVPDCDDPDLPAWIQRVVRSLSSEFTSAGIMALESDDFFRDWALSGESKNCRIVVEKATPGYFYGAYVLTKYEVTGNESDGKINTSNALASDGPVAWTTGAP